MKNLDSQRGFSMIELLAVIAIVGILSVFALLSMTSTRKYAADDEAKKLVDFLDEARQKALNQRTTFRVEIDQTANVLRLIDENDATTAADDTVAKTMPISPQVVMGLPSANIGSRPIATITNAAFATSSYPLSSGNTKITMRFRRNGQVVDTGTDNIGTGAIISGGTVYIYERVATGNPKVLRAVTVSPTAGDTSLFMGRMDSGGALAAWVR